MNPAADFADSWKQALKIEGRLVAKIEALPPEVLPKSAQPVQMMWRQPSRMDKDESDQSIEIKVCLQVEGNVTRIERVEVQPAAIGTVKP